MISILEMMVICLAVIGGLVCGTVLFTVLLSAIPPNFLTW